MCDCKMKLNDLLLNHKRCRDVEFIIYSEKKIDIVIPPIFDIVMTDFVNEVNNFFEETPMIQETPRQISEEEEEEEEEEDDIVELTDISPEELIAQEEEEKRIKDELALIQLTKLTKKKVRTKK